MNNLLASTTLALALALAGCSGGDVNAALAQDAEIVIETSGAWQGSVGSESGQESVSGVGDKTIPLKGNIISAAIQKKGDDDSLLVVKIVRDGKVLKESRTTAAYGMVAVAYDV